MRIKNTRSIIAILNFLLFFVVIGCNNDKEKQADKLSVISTDSSYTEADDDHEEEIVSKFPLSFESVSPNSMKHNNGLHEYIKLLIENGKITGIGVGTEDGEPTWEFDFEGSLTNDSIIELKVNYRQEGKDPVSENETWKYNSQKERMWLKGRNRPDNGREFAKVSGEFTPKYFLDILKRIEVSLNEKTP